MKQNILVLREPNFEDPKLLITDKSYFILRGLEESFDVSNIFQTSQAIDYFQAKKPDLVVLSLNKFLIQKISSFQKLRNLVKDIPILIICDELNREERIEINRISNTFAFELDAEERDLKNYLLRFRFQNAKARNFLRYKRSRELKIYFDNREVDAHFIDYSQTGAQIQYDSSILHNKMRIRIAYQSQHTDQLRQIESYVVWTGGPSRAGLQFLAVL